MLWDEEDGFYYDRRHTPDYWFAKSAAVVADVNIQKWKKKDLIPVRSVGAFAVLWSEVATPEQATRMVRDYLFNPKEFWTGAPVAALSRSCPWYTTTKYSSDIGCGWRANAWIPTNYMIYHGLRYYGMKEYASLLAHYTTKLVRENGNREYYNSETGEGCGLDPFWGWSLLGHFCEFENTLEKDITIIR